MIYENAEPAAKKIAKIFKQMEWEWCSKYGKYIPTEEEILRKFNKYAENIYNDDECMALNSGRLTVSKIRDTKRVVFGLTPHSYDEWVEFNEINHPLGRDEAD